MSLSRSRRFLRCILPRDENLGSSDISEDEGGEEGVDSLAG